MCSLEKAQKLVETENVEFYVLVQRMQEINARLEKDTAYLQKQKEAEEAKTTELGNEEQDLRKQKAKKLRTAKQEKEQGLLDKEQAIQNFENQKKDFSKWQLYQRPSR